MEVESVAEHEEVPKEEVAVEALEHWRGGAGTDI
jgi:hypothetical protein